MGQRTAGGTGQSGEAVPQWCTLNAYFCSEMINTIQYNVIIDSVNSFLSLLGKYDFTGTVQPKMKVSRYLLTRRLIESRVSTNISGALQKNIVAAFS